MPARQSLPLSSRKYRRDENRADRAPRCSCRHLFVFEKIRDVLQCRIIVGAEHDVIIFVHQLKLAVIITVKALARLVNAVTAASRLATDRAFILFRSHYFLPFISRSLRLTSDAFSLSARQSLFG